MSVNLIIGVCSIVGVVYIIAEAIYKYYHTPGTAITTAFHNSLTIAVVRLFAAITAGWNGVAELASYAGQPQIASSVHDAVPDEAKPWVVIGMLFIAEWARRRTLTKTDQ